MSEWSNSSHRQNQLLNDGWKSSHKPFWEEEPCFYDLGTIKTVILFFKIDEPEQTSRFEGVYSWRYGDHDPPEYLPTTAIEVRRYKLHHSMNALLWHDH